MRSRRTQAHRQGGFTLVELIVTIVLIGALVGVSAVFIVQPFQASEDLERRAALVDSADLALDRITREARRALPNSVRVNGDGDQVEFIPVRVGARYRRLPGGGSNDTFVPARQQDTFDILGGVFLDGDEVDAIDDAAGGAGTECGGGNPCISVYNTGQSGFNAYDEENIAQITSLESTSLGYDNGGANEPAFRAHSPQQRFYIFDDVVSYRCTNGQLLRYSGYGINGSIVAEPSNDPQVVTRNVASCDFRYAAGTAARRSLLTLRLELERGGERVFLLDQAQVSNTP